MYMDIAVCTEKRIKSHLQLSYRHKQGVMDNPMSLWTQDMQLLQVLFMQSNYKYDLWLIILIKLQILNIPII